jgi:ABC-type Fe3+ transport system permease subunit
VVWRIGGIMVYGSVSLGLAVVVGILIAAVVRRRRSQGDGPGHSLS